MPGLEPRQDSRTDDALRAAAIERRHGKVSHGTFVRRRIAVGVAAAVVVVAVVLVLAFGWPGFARSDAAPAPAVTVTAPAPTPTAAAAQLPADATPLLRATPGEAGAFARTAAAAAPTTGTGAGALEGWTLVYTGADAKVTVTLHQWETGDEASAAYDAAVEAAGTPQETGTVAVGGKKAGSWASFAADGGVTRWWRNGTVVFSATGPQEAVAALYAAFPL